VTTKVFQVPLIKRSYIALLADSQEHADNLVLDMTQEELERRFTYEPVKIDYGR